MSLQLRQAVPHDHELCLELLHSADEDDDRIRAAMTDAASTTYIAYDGTRAIGAAVMHWQDTDVEIVHIAVIEEMQGLGFGRKIIEALIAQARLRDMSAVLVGTANSSIGNIIFYQKCSFRMDHVRRDYFSYLSQPVMEDGILIRDMIVFRLPLD